MRDTQAPPIGEVEFQFEGMAYVMLFDWGALAQYERAMQESIFAIFAELERYQVAADAKVPNLMRFAPRMSAVGALVKAGLARHHPDVDYDLAMRMFADPAVQAALGAASEASMGGGDADAGELAPAPNIKARVPAKPASTGKKSLRAGSKPAARSKASGARRRG